MLEISVSTNARRTAVAGRQEGVWRIRLAARPVDGAANDELLRFLAEALDVRRSAVALVTGQTARRKRVRVALPPEQLPSRMQALLGVGDPEEGAR